MNLTPQQQALLDGAKGPAMAKVVKTLVMYGECFGAERMVPVTGANGHLVTSFGLSMLGPVYDLMDELLKDGALSGQSFSVDPRPLDPAVPANPLQKLLFKIMYSKQDDYEAQLRSMGLLDNDAFTCTCYQPEVGNRPRRRRHPKLGRKQRCGLCQLRAGRSLQSQLRHHRDVRLNRRLCPGIRPAHR